MIKVKGQISEMATCIIDQNTQIAGLARVFFSDLAKRVCPYVPKCCFLVIGIFTVIYIVYNENLFHFWSSEKKTNLNMSVCSHFHISRQKDI